MAAPAVKRPSVYARLSVPGAAATHHERWVSVDALRAIAALMVLVSHAPEIAPNQPVDLVAKGAARFAGKIVRQHQVAALCRERGWTYRLQGTFDSANTPTKALPAYGLQVELEAEPAGGEVAGSGIFVSLRTGNVRFSRNGKTVKPADVPARCFSEAMRDVDLLVTVGAR